MDQKHILNLKDRISDNNEQEGLDGGDHKKNAHFGNEIAAAAQVKEGFAFQNLLISNDLFCAHRQSHEECNDDAHEQVRRKVKILGEYISCMIRVVRVVVPRYESQDEGEERGFQQVYREVL